MNHCDITVTSRLSTWTVEDIFTLLADSLHHVLSEFGVVHPVRTNSEGRFLSASVSAHHVRRARSTKDAPTHASKVQNKRQTQVDSLHQTPPADSSPPSQTGPNGIGRGYTAKEAELFYNVTLFGQELHLHLHPNSRLIAPTATVEWWEESGHKHSQLIGHTDCFYTGGVSNMEDTSVAISNCDGLVGHLPNCCPDSLFWSKSHY